MLSFTLVPTLLITLINICVFLYVLRMKDRPRSGFFLLINALALIIWSGGRTLYESVGSDSPYVMALLQMAALLVPANFLYFALSRPKPIRPKADSPLVLFIVFMPAVFLALVDDYTSPAPLLFDHRLAVEELDFGRRAARAAALFTAFCFAISIAIFAIRYNNSSGHEKTLSKHLVAVITGPLIFAGFFWASSQRGGGISVIPSPSLICVIMAQAGLLAVIRQEELTRQRLLTRTAYYLTAVLVAVLLVFLVREFYALPGGRIVLDRTLGYMMMGATVLLLVLVRMRPVERILDRLVFERAAEYRQIVEETRQELREARERLRRAERLSVVGELAARVAHEIKNPLGPIKGYTQMMREKLEGNSTFEHRDKFLRYLDVIQEEAESIDRRVRQLLDQAQMTNISVRQVDVNRLVRRCVNLMEMEAAAQLEMGESQEPVKIHFNESENAGEILADQARLEEVVFNLGRNAVEALRDCPKGLVTISTRRLFADDTDGVEIRVEDNGPGFPSDYPDIFFEPFMSNKVGGTGLGLAIVKSYVEAHGGTVSLGNRKGTQGGVVTVWVPREAKENPGALLPKGGE